MKKTWYRQTWILRVSVITLRQPLLKWYFSTVQMYLRINTCANSLYTAHWSSSAFTTLSWAYQELVLPLCENMLLQTITAFYMWDWWLLDKYIAALRNNLEKFCHRCVDYDVLQIHSLSFSVLFFFPLQWKAEMSIIDFYSRKLSKSQIHI